MRVRIWKISRKLASQPQRRDAPRPTLILLPHRSFSDIATQAFWKVLDSQGAITKVINHAFQVSCIFTEEPLAFSSKDSGGFGIPKPQLLASLNAALRDVGLFKQVSGKMSSSDLRNFPPNTALRDVGLFKQPSTKVSSSYLREVSSVKQGLPKLSSRGHGMHTNNRRSRPYWGEQRGHVQLGNPVLRLRPF